MNGKKENLDQKRDMLKNKKVFEIKEMIEKAIMNQDPILKMWMDFGPKNLKCWTIGFISENCCEKLFLCKVLEFIKKTLYERVRAKEYDALVMEYCKDPKKFETGEEVKLDLFDGEKI
jgi:hypothetical protein